MASTSTQEEEEFHCAVCHEIYEDPVILSCSHSFCKLCLQDWWRGKTTKECPICKRCSKEEPITNLVLKNLCERRSATSDALCVQHGQKLTLFCLEDKVPTCLVCRDSIKHNNHRFRPIDEAALEQKVALQKLLSPLREKVRAVHKHETECCKMETHINVQAQHIEKQIQEQFQKLHHFLEEEEDNMLIALSNEEARKSQAMKRNIERLRITKAKLSATIRAAEDQLKVKDDISFLQNYKATVENVQRTAKLPNPQPLHGALMNVAQHLGNLTYNVWSKMQAMVSWTPVILDPNTAHDRLSLSEDLTCVKLCLPQQLPENTERCGHIYVQGSAGFRSGTHTWEVEVGDHTSWRIGVAERSYPRMLQGRCWLMVFRKGKYHASSTGAASTKLPVIQKPQRIKVQLDMLKGMLSFFDHDSNKPLHTFRHNFTKVVFPTFGIYMSFPLKVLPRNLRIHQAKEDR